MADIDVIQAGRTVDREIRTCIAVRMLADGGSPHAVALHIKVRHGTLLAWMRHPDFKALLEITTNFQHVKALSDRLEGLTPDALDALQRVMKEGNPAQALKAAESVMRWTQAYAERHHEVVKLADQRNQRRFKW